MSVQEEPVRGDNTSAVRTETGAFAVPFADRPPAAVRTVTNVRDQGSNVRECVRRALLRTALGESYAYDVVPIAAPDGNGGVEVGYVLYVSTALPVPIGARVAVASKPFEFDSTEETIIRVANAVVESLRTAVRTSLMGSETIPPVGHPER